LWPLSSSPYPLRALVELHDGQMLCVFTLSGAVVLKRSMVPCMWADVRRNTGCEKGL
jgi:hypothetical protein